MIPDDLQGKFHQVASLVAGLMTQLRDGPGLFGLIHADLHLDNALFLPGGGRLIDFDDCGFGYRLYDIAVGLWELRHRDDYENFRDDLDHELANTADSLNILLRN